MNWFNFVVMLSPFGICKRTKTQENHIEVAIANM